MSKEKEILDKELSFNYGDELDKIQNHISTLRFVAISSVNSLEEKDKEIEELKRVINDLSVPKDAFLYTYKDIEAKDKEIERLNNIINRTTKYVESLSSKGRGCDIYEDIKQEILKELKGSDK